MEALQDQCYLSKAYPIMKHVDSISSRCSICVRACVYVVCTCVTKTCAFLLREITD